MVNIESLKYPMYYKPCRNDIHVQRRKDNINMLRESFKHKNKGRAAVILIGMASESHFDDMKISDHITRSIFDVIAMKNYSFTQNLGLALNIKGFLFGKEIERITSIVVKELNRIFFENHIQDSIFSLLLKSNLISNSWNALRSRLEECKCDSDGINRFSHSLFFLFFFLFFSFF